MSEEIRALKVTLTGQDPDTFARLFNQLAGKVQSAIESVSGGPASEGTKQTLNDVTKIAQTFLQAKLERPSLENQKLLAEIAEKFAAAEASAQHARKTAAEADRLELDNAMYALSTIAALIAKTQEIKALISPDNNHLIIDASAPRLLAQDEAAGRKLLPPSMSDPMQGGT